MLKGVYRLVGNSSDSSGCVGDSSYSSSCVAIPAILVAV